MTTGTTPSHISDAMLAVVGQELRRVVSHPVSESDIRRWAVATYYPEPPPGWFIEADGNGPLTAPEEFNPFAWSVAESRGINLSGEIAKNPDGIEAALNVAGPGLKNVLNGTLEIDYGVRLLAGDVVTAVTILDGYQERSGKLGMMLFTTLRTTWTNQRGDLVKTERNTNIRY